MGSGKTHTMFGDGVTRDEIRKTYGLNTNYKGEFDRKSINDANAFDGINGKSTEGNKKSNLLATSALTNEILNILSHLIGNF